MAERTIQVTLIEEMPLGVDPGEASTKVIAHENPTGASPGDTVAWSWDADTAARAGKDLQVMFREVELADGSGTALCGPSGPFAVLSRTADRIVGTISADAPKGLYLYDIFRDSRKLGWMNPLPPGRNFGGLDVPPLPPRGRD
jgi:hypothetical protein